MGGGLICPACGKDNPTRARFCMECGTALERRCDACGESLPAEARFCPSCGSAVIAAAVPGAPPLPVPEPPPEERRRVTVLFADLVGYTAAAERLDPETVKRLAERCLRRLADIVNRYGGTVDKFIGDNVMALFGAPVAHEDDELRAVRAGLDMQTAMAELGEELERQYGARFQLRVGINTGEVLAGIVGERYTVTGDPVNVASRLQTAAAPGSVTIGDRTRRACADGVEVRALPALTLKGKAEPVQAWEAIAVQAGGSRGPRKATPLVGRDDELELLISMLNRARHERRAELVTIIGEPGVGKSRLAQEMMERLRQMPSPPDVREGRCLPYGGGVVYWALSEVLRQECGIVDADPPATAKGKLVRGVGGLLSEETQDGEESRDRKIALIARLLGIGDAPEPAAVEAGEAERMREAFFSAVLSTVQAMARRRALVLVMEDIHWADEGMLDLIDHLAQWVRAPLLIVCLAREELLANRPAWGAGRRRVASISLQPLDDEEARALVGALLPASLDRGELATAIAQRAGGNPFFVEELVHRLVEEGGGDTIQGLPDTLQGLLAARLDSLEPFERRLLQHAAVFGRAFWPEILAPVADAERGDLEVGLRSLMEKELLVPGEAERFAGEPELAFRHVLIRDVAYATLPKAVRARKHLEIARLIETRASDRVDEVTALLAEHYARAATLGSESHFEPGELEPIIDEALRYLEAAGDAAAAFYSNAEALTHYEWAARLPVGDETVRERIGEKRGDLLMRLGRVDAAVEAWEECLDTCAAHGRHENVARLHRKIGAALWHKGERSGAIEHHQKGINLLKDAPRSLELVRLYEEAASLYMQTGDNMLAIYAAEKALRLAEQLNETRAASRAHGIFGRVFGRIGDLDKARESLERSVELARGLDRSETILALVALGHHLKAAEAEYAEAERVYGDALALAEEIGDVPSEIEINSALAELAAYRGDWERVQRASDLCADLAEREGLAGKLCLPWSLRGLVAWRAGDFAGAENFLRRAYDRAEQVGWSEVAWSALIRLARTQHDRGDRDGALATLDRALEVSERAGLVVQQVHTQSARAVTLALDGQDGPAAEAAAAAIESAARVPYPTGRAAALEAQGVTGDAAMLGDAAEAWDALGRPLDAARCRFLAGMRLADEDFDTASGYLGSAAEAYERLGVPHLAQRARTLSPPRLA